MLSDSFMPTAIDILYDTSLTLRLLCANNAPLVLGFLQEAFKERNLHSIREEDLELMLDRHLAEPALLDGDAGGAENRARNYLNLWCSDANRYVRKRFNEADQCFVYELTRHSEKALQWLRELQTGLRLGHTTTESRFSRIFNELQVLSQQTKEDPQLRLRDLLAQRDAIDAEIQEIRATGKVRTLDATQVKDRLIDLEGMVESFLADFRAIEDRFKEQAIELHEIYLERGRSKGDIVAHALDANEVLRNSEQGRSYYGFRELIRSHESRERLSLALDDVAKLASNSGMDERVFVSLMDRLLIQGNSVQESFRRIAAQLRRVVEEASSQDTRLLMEWIAEIKQKALALRDTPPIEDEDGAFMQIDEGIAWGNLMELGFYEKKESGKFSPVISSPAEDNEDVLAAVRKVGKPLNLEEYRRRVDSLLKQHEQIALSQVLLTHPLQEGVVDLVCYLCVATDKDQHLIDEAMEQIDLNRPNQPRFATMNRIIYQRQ
ncbi:MAG: DUF3375 family protein [Verrucomicrobiota bacterium]|nr:DUF3375 family protein [Verrucomicrobiota bacterium]